MFLKTYLVVLLVSLLLGITVKIISISENEEMGWISNGQADRAISLVFKTILFIWGIVELACFFK